MKQQELKSLAVCFLVLSFCLVFGHVGIVEAKTMKLGIIAPLTGPGAAACTGLSNPKMIFLDEPFMGLAPMVTSRVFRAKTEINKRGITILLIEQDAVKSLKIASFGYILQQGEILVYGDTEKLRNNEIVKQAYLRG